MGSARLTLRRLRTLRTSCALFTGLLAVVSFGPVAHARDGGTAAGLAVAPASPAPGTDVTLRVSGCSGATGTAGSDAFVANARLTGAGGTLTGETRIRTALRSGPHDVRVTCADHVVGGSIVVVARASGQPSSPSSPSAPASPVAPVDAGGGGTARLAVPEARPAEPGTAHTVMGLVLAGVAAVAVGLLGARRSRGTR